MKIHLYYFGKQRDPHANADRPNWLSAGLVRLLVLCAFIVLVEMLRPHLSPHSAGLIAIAGAVAVLAGAAVFVGAARRLSERQPFLSRSQQEAEERSPQPHSTRCHNLLLADAHSRLDPPGH